MTPSLREQRRLQTGADLSRAALELFAEHGYAAVTVAQVAARAGVGERTLYRYFADKGELLFGGDEEVLAALRAAIDGRPDGEAPFALVRAVSAELAQLLEDRRDEVRRRAAVIAATPELAERERAKQASLAQVLADGLGGRGVDAGRAHLLARVAIACHDEALRRWLVGKRPGRSLREEADAAFDELRALAEG